MSKNPFFNRIRQHGAALVISLYFVLLALAYGMATPIFEGPDEAGHFFYVQVLLETGELPPLLDYESMWAGEESTLQAHHPPLYYFLGAPLVALTERADLDDYTFINPFAASGTASYNNLNAWVHRLQPRGDTHLAVWMLRLLSISMGTVTLWLVYGTAQTVSGSRGIGLAAMLLVASLPTFIFVSAMASNDNLTTMLYAAGTFWTVRIWQKQTISLRDMLLLGLILAGIALTKLNGLTLFGVVWGALILGMLLRRLSWKQVLLSIGISGAMAALLAGWWYLRNLQVYGDPFALDATLRIWSRGSPPRTLEAALFEARGVWESFWFVLGAFNVRGADWVYSLAALLTAVGGAGLLVAFWRRQSLRWLLLILLGIVLLAITALILATRQINVSQGRILFPMLAAWGTLMVIGWRELLGKRFYALLLIPLVIAALSGPFALRRDFAFPQIVGQLPADAIPLNAFVGNLEMVGYRLHQTHFYTDDVFAMTLYVRGNHPQNPALFVKLIDPVSDVPVGGVDTYPGMTLTEDFSPDVIYAIPIRFEVDETRVTGFFSRQMDLVIGWRIVDPADLDVLNVLPWRDAVGNPLDTLRVPASVFVQPDYKAEFARMVEGVQFGENIALLGTTLSATELQPGEALEVTTAWETLATPNRDWVLSVGLVDDTFSLVTNADGDPAFFPTSGWLPGLQHNDTRTLIIPPETAPGEYRLYLAWYDRSTGERLIPQGSASDTARRVWLLPETVTIR